MKPQNPDRQRDVEESMRQRHGEMRVDHPKVRKDLDIGHQQDRRGHHPEHQEAEEKLPVSAESPAATAHKPQELPP